MAGRPRKPLKIHELDGTYRADRHAGSVAKSTGGKIPPMPQGMDNTARAMWRYVVKTRGDWMAESDGAALRSLCETWALRCKCQKIVQADPTNKNARTSFVSYQQDCLKLFARFGMTPVDRAKIGEQSAEELDPAAEFVA